MGLLPSARVLALGLVLGGAIGVLEALATAPLAAAAPDDKDEARRLFQRGKELFLGARCEEALPLLEKSYNLVRSPNSVLLIARCQRDLGRPEDAATRFDETAAVADERVAAGEQSYAQTAATARSEGAAVRAMLAQVRVRVAHAPADAVIETPDVHTKLGADGSASFLHRPGSVAITVRGPTGAARSVTAELRARVESTVDIDFTAPVSAGDTGSAAAGEAPARKATWALPAGIALGVVGLAGAGVFVGFGLSARATYADLESQCDHHCSTPDQIAEADRGRTQQTIAVVGAVAGAVGIVGGVALIAVGWPRRAAASASVGISPSAIALRARF